MNPQKLKKLEKLAKVLDGGDVELLTQIDNVESELTSRIDKVAEQIPALRQAKDGQKGERGKDGADGKDGKDGRDGKDGKSIKGDRGEKGKDGRDGKDGESIKGADGKDGKDGADGFVDDATVGYLEAELKRIDKKNGGYGQVVRKLQAGSNVTIDDSNMEYPIISAGDMDEAAEWGKITGTLSDQTDLQAELDTKLDITYVQANEPTGTEGELWLDTDESLASSTVPVATKTSAYTLTSSDSVILANGTFTLTLPTAVGIAGKIYRAKNVGTGVVTVDGDGSETIDGSATQIINIQYDAVSVISDGLNWYII